MSLSATTNDLNETEIISDQMTWLAMKFLMLGITPTISLLGIVGNIFSIIVLKKQGLNKCSNILLVALAFSDITFLISFNSIPKILYEAVWNHEYVGYSKSGCDTLFIFFSLFTVLDYTFGLMGMTLPMLITAERLLVIFLPLSFGRFVTPFRTWMAVMGVAVYWMSIFMYSSLWQVLEYDFDSARNVSVGLIKRSDFFLQHLEDIALTQDLSVYTSMVIPPMFTVLGCIVISIQLQVTAIKRRKLMSKTRTNNRTTRTLLGVCAVYCVTSTIYTLPLFIPNYASYSLTDEHPSNVSKLFYQLVNTICCINCSCDFIVYVALNKHFRDTLKNVVHCSGRGRKVPKQILSS